MRFVVEDVDTRLCEADNSADSFTNVVAVRTLAH